MIFLVVQLNFTIDEIFDPVAKFDDKKQWFGYCGPIRQPLSETEPLNTDDWPTTAEKLDLYYNQDVGLGMTLVVLEVTLRWCFNQQLPQQSVIHEAVSVK